VPLTWPFARGAGDGNRTRTVSLGKPLERADMASELRVPVPAGYSLGPVLTAL
jgi:hypothetical protein